MDSGYSERATMRRKTNIPRDQFVKERRVGLYILPETRDRLNRIKDTFGHGHRFCNPQSLFSCKKQ